MNSHSGQPDYQPFPNYNSYVAELVSGTVYVPIVCSAPQLPEFMFYVDNLLSKIRISPITAVIALIYCSRLRLRLPRRAVGSPDTIHRVYTASLLLACKYTGEPFTHSDISEASGFFSLRDINRIEFELIRMIDYQLWISSEDLQEFVTENQDGLYSVLKYKDIDA